MLDKETLKILTEKYPVYKVKDINTGYIKPIDLYKKLNKNRTSYTVELVGKSIGKREIYKVRYGNGKIKVLIWTQMHGDEPTATSAILDLLNFFEHEDDIHNLKKKIKENLTISIIPMLNPDGAELFTRENLIGIDINRDALRLQTPEAQILKEEFEKFKPDFAFNMHDQNCYYTIGNSDKLPSISFLAPPFDYNGSMNSGRIKSMKLIVELNQILSSIQPASAARYKDDHEPRSFGDYFSSRDTSVILIESGNSIEGDGKELIRKLNFLLLLAAFDTIADNSFIHNDESLYFAIPENKERMYDLILRNVTLERFNQSFTVDIGIKRTKKYDTNGKRFYYTSNIEEIGDLSTYTAWEDYNLEGFTIQPLKYYYNENSAAFSDNSVRELLKKGYGFIVDTLQSDSMVYTTMPINLARSNKFIDYPAIGQPANMMLLNKSNEYYVLINGFIVSSKDLNFLPDLSNKIKNALIFD
ncbi:M14 family zinc carboxypeptidase [Melioribacter sp. OK-6-Me]|uniref:M14 family zinc carboxypeptidase n=1 Tax=unclassified Melioribacter TaxID=2627329 RepID=UPI003ED83E7F